MKKIIPFSVILSVFLFVSCLTDEEKIERTNEIEMQELDELLSSLAEEGYVIDTTDLGVYYIVNEEGSGPTPQEGDTITIEYIGAFTDGTVFDASQSHWIDGKWTFVYLEQALIPGFDNALSVMNVGSEIDAIIPSSLGYGITGSGSIPPYTTLIFNLTLHEILPKADE